MELSSQGYRLDWRRIVPLPQTQQPGTPAVVEDGRVYLTTRDLGLEALDLATGELLWRKQFELTYRRIGFPAVYDGTVFLNLFGHSSTSGNTPNPALVSVDAATGAELFRTDHEGQSGSGGQPVVNDGRAFMSGGYFGGIDGYNAQTGERLWFRELGLDYNWVPAVDDSHVYVYNNGNYADTRGELRVIDPQTGTFFIIPDPQSPTLFNEPETPVLGPNNRVYVSRRGTLIAFDTVDREIDYSKSIQLSEFSIDGEKLYGVSRGGLVELALSDGSELRRLEIEDLGFNPAPLLTDSHVLVRTQTETVAVNRTSWQVDWSLPFTGRMSYADGTLLIGDSFAGVAAFVVVPEPGAALLLLVAIAAATVSRRGSNELGRS